MRMEGPARPPSMSAHDTFPHPPAPKHSSLPLSYRKVRMRGPAALLLLLCIASGVALGDCVTACPEEDGDAGCPPSCTHCVCCSHAQAPGLLMDCGSAPERSVERQEPTADGEPSSGTSPDILHVPRVPGLSA